MTQDTDVRDALAEEITRHKLVGHIRGDDPKREGIIRDGGYACACGAIVGVREYVPTGHRSEREHRPVGLTQDQHVAEAVLKFLEGCKR